MPTLRGDGVKGFFYCPRLVRNPTGGGPLFETQASGFYENLYFSYSSYTTIGYGNIGPMGPLVRFLAGSEAYLSTILAALLVYALVNRSEL
ncbi:ion channel [Natrinema pallidum]|uniref:Potassium channel domain-containing protein n=1 Tax=Natrinema pallidum DSM 3751 TaxID=1227495 RepID=L9YYI1_9EURY|nr:ion channel [Natrinema pallidum]ELY79325.1 hypothetical protein C487_06438 [Natrinema pallidum DSM 3751]